MRTQVFGRVALVMILTASCILAGKAQVWNRQIIDSTGIDQGSFCDIAIDGSDNPWVVYMDVDFLDLKLTTRTGNQWSTEAIDTSGYTGWSPGIAIDSNDSLHICFDNGALLIDPTANFGVNYMHQDQDEWVKEKIEPYELYLPQNSTSIVLNSNDEPIIGYWNQTEEFYCLAYLREGEWIKKVSPYEYTSLGLAIKSDDTPVALLDKGDSLMLVSYLEDTDTWEHHTVPYKPYVSMGLLERAFMVLDDNDHVHIVDNMVSYETIPFTYSVTYISFDWENWTKETVTSDVYETPAIVAVDRNNNPAVLTFQGSPKHLTLFRRIEGEWTQESVDINCEKFDYADMAFDHSNLPHIVLKEKPEDIISEKEKMLIYYDFSPGLPDLSCHPAEFQFGEVWTESYRALKGTIKNGGVAALIVGGYELSNESLLALEGPSFPAFVQPGDSLCFTLKFDPQDATGYSENLRFATNDPVNPMLDIPVYGTGISTGSSSILELYLKDIYADFDFLTIDQDDPLQGAEISLYKEDQLVGSSQVTDKEGFTRFESLNPGNYKIILFKAAESDETDMDCSREEMIAIGPGFNSLESALADSLFHYQVWLKNKLLKLRETGNPAVPWLNYEKAMNKVDPEMENFADDFDPDYTESLVRLLLVEYMVHDLFEEGYSLGDEMFKDFGDLIAFIFYSNDWATQLLDLLFSIIQAVFQGDSSAILQEILQMLMEEIIKNEIHDLVSESLKLVGGEIGYPGDEILLEAWHNVWNAYSSGWNFSFGSEEWGRIIMEVKDFLEALFIQYVYIDQLTSPSIGKGLDYALDNQHSGSFFDAFEQEIDYAREEKNSVEMALDAAEFFRVSAELLMVTANIMSWIGTIPGIPYADIIDQIAFNMKISAYLEVATALGISTVKFFYVPSNMENTVKKIYFPVGGGGKKSLEDGLYWPGDLPVHESCKAEAVQISNLKNKILEDQDNYETILETIKGKFQSGDRVAAAPDILALREADKQKKNSFMLAASPIVAVANQALDTLGSFQPMWDSLKVQHARAGQDRYLTYFRLMFAISDTTGDSDILMADLIDQNMESNQVLTTQVVKMLDTISVNLSIPAVLVASVTETSHNTLELGQSGVITLVVTNTGAVSAEDVFLRVSCNEALELAGSDSISIGTLAPGEASNNIELTFTCTDESLQLGTWNATIGSKNARTLPCSGSFLTESTTGWRSFKTSNSSGSISIYPNPVNENGEIIYSLEQHGEASISLYDLSGRKLQVLIEKEQVPGNHKISFDCENLDNGNYYIILKLDGRIIDSEKLIKK